MTNLPKELMELHQSMKKCRACLEEGFEIYPPAVISGTGSAQFMTIGQAPGITEQEAQRPFNAGSGKRLFDWLGLAGIDEDWFRATQYMTSVTKCYPGRQPSGSGDRVPGRREQELCRPFLDQEIEIVDPKVIIPIGRLAINLYFPKKTEASGDHWNPAGGLRAVGDSFAPFLGRQSMAPDRGESPFDRPSNRFDPGKAREVFLPLIIRGISSW